MPKKWQFISGMVATLARNGGSFDPDYAEDERICIYSEYDSGTAFIKGLNSPFKPDVCLIDVVLKDISGIEYGKRIKEKKPDIHTVIMTAYPDAESFSEARKIGADYVEKSPCLEALAVN